MLKNYIRVALRNIVAHKSHSFINISGLAIGLASCLIIYFHVINQLSFDKFHRNHDRIYRVTNSFERTSGERFYSTSPPALAPSLENVAGIERVTRFRYADDNIYTIDHQSFSENSAVYVDSAFLRVFDFKLKAGNRITALSAPNTVVLTVNMSMKFFGTTDALGKTILFNNDRQLVVTGILESIPEDSHLDFDILISFETFYVPEGYLADLHSWSWMGFNTYILLSPQANEELIRNRITAIYHKNYNRPHVNVKVELQPLSSIYLGSEKFGNSSEYVKIGNKSIVYSLSIVAFLILVISCFNFMNISTALSLNRGKEIGIRKVMGASRGKVVLQFLVETSVISLSGLVIATLMIIIASPLLREQLGVYIPTNSDIVRIFPFAAIGTIAIGLISGLYPSLIFSSYSPVSALKSGLKTGKYGSIIRNGLVYFQFMISVLLVALSLIMIIQIDYLANKILGFDKENIIKIRVLNESMDQFYSVLKIRYEQLSQVQKVAMASHSFDDGSSSGPARLLGAPEEESHLVGYYQVDNEFLDITGIKLIEGRFFQKEFITDSSAVVLNESAIAAFELEEPIGSVINVAGQDRNIIGIVEDFHFNSLHSEITPLAIIKPFTDLSTILVKVNPGNIGETLSVLKREWDRIVGNVPFDASYLNDNLKSMYKREEQFARATSTFSLLAIILSCMGLYAILSFSVHAKLKEISIRKVLGANVIEILIVLSKPLYLITLFASLSAIPMITIVGNNWLDNFAYKVAIPWWIYIGSGGFLFVIVALTVGRKIIRAAHTNPVSILNIE